MFFTHCQIIPVLSGDWMGAGSRKDKGVRNLSQNWAFTFSSVGTCIS